MGTTTSILTNSYTSIFQTVYELFVSVLYPLIAVEYLRFRVYQSSLQSLDTSLFIQGCGNLNAQNIPAKPVQYHCKVNKTVFRSDIGDIRTPKPDHEVQLSNFSGKKYLTTYQAIVSSNAGSDTDEHRIHFLGKHYSSQSLI